MNSKLLENFISYDRPTLDGWERASLDNLDDAVLYRLALLANRGTFDSAFEHDEIAELKAAIVAPVPRFTFSGDHPEAAYLIFADGSLYFKSNSQSEVWADACEFITERILDRGTRDASEFRADSDEGKLIRHSAAHLIS